MQVPTIPLKERRTTFNEVEIGFTIEQAVAEANRCVQCKEPKCVLACPAGVNIPGFIKAFREGDVLKAIQIIREKNFFPSICGRICQHEKQCEGSCVLAKTSEGAVCIGGIERFVGDNAPLPKRKNLVGKKIAVIGSGPSGLSVAAYLSLIGMHVTVLEGTNAFGGVIKYGVPEFRLPKKVVSRELNSLHSLGIDFEPNAKIDEEGLESISSRFDAVFIGTGVGKSRILDVPGSSLKGVMSAMKFLINLNQSNIPMIEQNESVLVVGAGYVGIDAARSAVRLGGSVTCVTLDTEKKAFENVSRKDYEEAMEEGVKFLFETKVKEITGREKVDGVTYSNHSTGRIDCTKVICAIGQEPAEDSLKTPIQTSSTGIVEVNELNQTTISNVFAAGDCVHGPKTVIHAIDSGRRTAQSIIRYLDEKIANEEMGIKKVDSRPKIIKGIDLSNKDI